MGKYFVVFEKAAQKELLAHYKSGDKTLLVSKKAISDLTETASCNAEINCLLRKLLANKQQPFAVSAQAMFQVPGLL